jgi:hypothetical protein
MFCGRDTVSMMFRAWPRRNTPSRRTGGSRRTILGAAAAARIVRSFRRRDISARRSGRAGPTRRRRTGRAAGVGVDGIVCGRIGAFGRPAEPRARRIEENEIGDVQNGLGVVDKGKGLRIGCKVVGKSHPLRAEGGHMEGHEETIGPPLKMKITGRPGSAAAPAAR